MGESDQGYRGARILLAGGILLGGMAAASLFRRPAAPDDPLAGDRQDRPVYWQPSEVRSGSSAQDAQPVEIGSPVSIPPRFGVPGVGAVVSGPAKETTPKPSGPRDARSDASAVASAGKALLNPVRLEESVRVHRIVDGDTLGTLADRYLGDPRRAREIFEANRGMLSDPEALPIGAELRIPPRIATEGR